MLSDNDPLVNKESWDAVIALFSESMYLEFPTKNGRVVKEIR
jgi:hypothetical protein